MFAQSTSTSRSDDLAPSQADTVLPDEAVSQGEILGDEYVSQRGTISADESGPSSKSLLPEAQVPVEINEEAAEEMNSGEEWLFSDDALEREREQYLNATQESVANPAKDSDYDGDVSDVTERIGSYPASSNYLGDVEDLNLDVDDDMEVDENEDVDDQVERTIHESEVDDCFLRPVCHGNEEFADGFLAFAIADQERLVRESEVVANEALAFCETVITGSQTLTETVQPILCEEMENDDDEVLVIHSEIKIIFHCLFSSKQNIYSFSVFPSQEGQTSYRRSGIPSSRRAIEASPADVPETVSEE
jgi:hypothetical protein